MPSLRIVHTTRVTLDRPAAAVLETRLTPRRHRFHQLVTRPPAAERCLGRDAFDNAVWRVTLARARSFQVSAVSTVESEPRVMPAGAWTVAQAQRAPRDDRDGVGAYAAALMPPGGELVDALERLSRQLAGDIAYRADDATERTPAEVLARRAGVCRDLAHLAGACLRAHGIPTRYAAGYVTGMAAMHAWVAVACPAGGFIEIDPTLGRLCDERHVLVALGDSYRDVPPLMGSLGEERRQRLESAVHVERLAATG